MARNEPMARRVGRAARALGMAAILTSLGACDMATQIQDGMKVSETAAATIEKQLGVKPRIGFNYQNGDLAGVTVSFEASPTASVAEIERVSRAAVVDAFKKEPDTLVVSFVFPKKT